MLTDYLIIRQDGELWHFFMKEGQGLCLRKKQGYKWAEHEILLDNAIFEFALAQSGENIHIACQDNEGSVLYLVYSNSVWHKYTILKSKSPKAYSKYFSLTPLGSRLVLCYTLIYDSKTMIAAQTVGNSTEPAVVDVITESDRPFCCVAEKEDIRVFYTNEKGVLGSRLYRPGSNSVGGFEAIVGGGQGFVYPDVFGRFHIAMITSNGISYCRRNLDGEYEEHKVVAHNAYGAKTPIILCEGEKMWIMWEAGGQIFYSLSVNDATDFSEPVHFIFSGESRQFYIVSGTGVSSCFGYVFSGEIHLFIQSSQTKMVNADIKKAKPAISGIKAVNNPTVVSLEKNMAKIKTKDVTADIEAQKTKILLAILNQQVKDLKKQMGLLSKRVEELENPKISS